MYIFSRLKRYLFLPWEGCRTGGVGGCNKMGDDGRKTCGEGRRGRGNYVFRESGELPSTEELWISALAEMQVREEVPFSPWLDFPAAKAHHRDGGREKGRDDNGGKNKRRDVNEIKRVRGMYLCRGCSRGHDYGFECVTKIYGGGVLAINAFGINVRAVQGVTV